MLRTFSANIGEGFRSVLRHPLRSALTAITSAVAIAVTVNVISLSYGMDEDIRRGIFQFGRRTIDIVRVPVILPGAKRVTFGPAQVDQIREVLAGQDVTLVPRRQTVVQLKGEASRDHVPLVCVAPGYRQTLDIGMIYGRWWNAGETDACVIDLALSKKLFPDVVSAEGRTIEMKLLGETRTVRVVGVLGDPLPYRDLFETFDSSQALRTLTASLLSFRNVYMPLETLGEVEGGSYSGVSIVVARDADVPLTEEKLRGIWEAGPDDPEALLKSGIGVFVRRSWMEALGTNTRQGADAGNIIWMLIVLVAAIMISTLHLISVRERYDELAIRRCEGARRRDVALQITTEGVLTSLAGGLLGLPIGFAGAAVLRRIVDFPFRFELRYAIIATIIAAILGLIASVLPARHVARLQPARVLTRRLR